MIQIRVHAFEAEGIRKKRSFQQVEGHSTTPGNDRERPYLATKDQNYPILPLSMQSRDVPNSAK